MNHYSITLIIWVIFIFSILIALFYSPHANNEMKKNYIIDKCDVFRFVTLRQEKNFNDGNK